MTIGMTCSIKNPQFKTLKYKRDYFNFYIFAWANKMSNICTPL